MSQLPMELRDIFKNKQKSYKMSLIHCLTIEGMYDVQNGVHIDELAERFRTHYQKRDHVGLPIDLPPTYIGDSWATITIAEVKTIMQNPIKALEKILMKNAEDVVQLRPDLVSQLHESQIDELREYAKREENAYYASISSTIPLRDNLLEVMNSYVQARTESIKEHPIDQLVRKTIPDELRKLPYIQQPLIVQGSVGKGNWATIPWIAIMNEQITKSTQYGEYLVYLFAEDMSAVYLTFLQGVTEPLKQGKKAAYQYLQNKVIEIRKVVPLEGMNKDRNIILTESGGLGDAYQESTIAYFKYTRETMPSDEQLLADLRAMIDNYTLYAERRQVAVTAETNLHEETEAFEVEVPILEDHLRVQERVNQIKTFIAIRGFSYPGSLIENFYLSLKTKPFVILAGISGTGKTKLVKLFAESLGATEQNKQFALIPVRPDWSDPSDLIGYQDLAGKFRPGPLTKVLLEAMQPANRNKPYFICLDEMNLARVEHYFSDMLSILETQRREGERIVTDTIVPQELLQTMENDGTLSISNLVIPDNVFLIGTVNMDETTHPFSKKVLDRANTLEFNYIRLDDFPMERSGDSEQSEAVPASFLKADYLALQDAFSEHQQLVRSTTGQLVEVNQILEELHAHVGFRVRDAICFYMIYNQRFELLDENAAFDTQLLQKILPRIQGSSQSVKRVLIALMQFCVGKKGGSMSDLEMDSSELYKPWRSYNETPEARYPQSARKLAYMLRRLEEDGFTSFWLS
ncbi:dynein-related subfamily AAA family protein [Paenibacillus cellulosilyticus]|uniref:Dynein-related subfamily AAA family protein n=1 Tax=Paenibacillus cellulosilyticus TaxID=375489 RepID=A0A2V2YPZ9_9BACL|nr:DUF3578 domain-containing protein [Paenibacillus cellulosilyticus]PWV98525.1 dynein-related subfamily AAA family protein [Paenibacillus cellulosilyticus]QKS44133.1 DUF3578 domain-containing protein [Paenibacillus cellulosilyticus]